MNPQETSLIARHYLGEYVKKETKSTIDSLINDGIWMDDFDLAVTPNDLTDEEHDKLIRALEKRNGLTDEWGQSLKEAVDAKLNTLDYLPMESHVLGESDILIHDHLRIMRFKDCEVLWTSKRISYDGIEIQKITDKEVIGLWFLPTADEGIWSAFRLNINNGNILVGEEIKFG